MMKKMMMMLGVGNNGTCNSRRTDIVTTFFVWLVILIVCVNGQDSTSSSDFISVTTCHLVDTRTQLDVLELHNGITYNTNLVGEHLTIRCDVDVDSLDLWVQFNVDEGRTVRAEPTAPYVLAGKVETSGKLYASNSLQLPGKHTVQACPVNTGAPMDLPTQHQQQIQGQAGQQHEQQHEQQRPYKPGKGPNATESTSNNNNNNNNNINNSGNVPSQEQEDDEDDKDERGGRGRFSGLLNRDRDGILSNLLDRIRDNNSNDNNNDNDKEGFFNREEGNGILSNLSNRVSNFLASSSGNRTPLLLERNNKNKNRKLEEEEKIIDDGCLSLTFYVLSGQHDDDDENGNIDNMDLIFPPTPVPAPVTDASPYPSHPLGELSSSSDDWKPYSQLTLGFQGPEASEGGTSFRGYIGDNRASSVFAEYAADVTFVHVESNAQWQVPAYFAAANENDTDNDNDSSGNVWLCHFVPPHVGTYTWTVRFVIGVNVAAYGGVDSADYFDGQQGEFTIQPSDDNDTTTTKGRLQHVDKGKHYFQWSNSQEYFYSIGSASPENLLAYEDFDNTPRTGQSFAPHVSDYVTMESTTWQGGKGTGLIGAINYLAKHGGANTISVIPLDVDNNVTPFVSIDSGAGVFGYDVSKLAQWEIALRYASTKLGMTIRVQFQEDDVLDDGNTYEQRIIFYREMVARFGHLNVIWEFTGSSNHMQELIQRTKVLQQLDPYQSPIVVTISDADEAHENVYRQLIGIPSINGISLAVTDITQIGYWTQYWVEESAKAGHPWVVMCHQQGDILTGLETVSTDTTTLRSQVVWGGNLMAGGAGIQYYLGTSLGSQLQDFALIQPYLAQSVAAQLILKKVPFQDMRPMTNTNSNDMLLLGLPNDKDIQVLADAQGSHILLYLSPPTSRTTTPSITLTLPGTLQRSYTTQWYNPQTGESVGSTVQVVNGGLKSVLTPPTTAVADSVSTTTFTAMDWVIYIQCQSGCESSN